MQAGLDVVVCNYRTPDDLGGFLDSYDRFPPKTAHDVFVVNIHPNEADRKVAHEWLACHPNALEIDIPENVGYGKACNKAAKAGSREIVAFFNADIELTENALDECYEALKTHPMWGVLGPRQVDQDGLIRAAGVLGTPTAPNLRGWREDGSDGRYSDVRSDCVSVAGSAFFFKRVLWEELTECELYQQVDPGSEGAMLQTPLFFEETWAAYHARAHTYRCAYLGTTTIIHKFRRGQESERKEPRYDHTGAWSTAVFRQSQEMFRKACEIHNNLPCD